MLVSHNLNMAAGLGYRADTVRPHQLFRTTETVIGSHPVEHLQYVLIGHPPIQDPTITVGHKDTCAKPRETVR
jgi:hypothetical protein